MELDRGIGLSKKHAKAFAVFPSFFAPALSAFYRLHTDKGFLKPKLSTWRNEACVELQRGSTRVLVQYEWPNFVEVRIARSGQTRDKHFVLYERFQRINRENVTALAEPLYKFLQKAFNRIAGKIEDE